MLILVILSIGFGVVHFYRDSIFELNSLDRLEI